MAEGKNLYETVIVTSAKLGEEGSAELVGRFKALIERHGGTVQSVDDWGKRRFAYPIQKQTEGYYTLINFESDPEFTAELDRRYQITDGILRTLIVKRDPRYLDAQKPQKPHQDEEEAPAEPVAEAVEAAPVEEAPVEESAPVEEVPAEESVEETPAEEPAEEAAPAEEE
ncbi:MAG: 30S ribosomal protein S6 [Acutalibacter sp.]|nr:30S ribosomal protein S6 [Acutalibacter sp.]